MKKSLICPILFLLCGLLTVGCSNPHGDALTSRSAAGSALPTVSSVNTAVGTTANPPETTEIPDPVTTTVRTAGTVTTANPPDITDWVTPPETVPSSDGSYQCDPYLFYANLTDPEVYADACRLVDAISAHEDSLTVSDSRVAGILVDNIFYNYPPAALCTFQRTDTGISIGYTYSEVTHKEMISAFYAKVETILNTTLNPDWSEERKAMELYRWTADSVDYFTVDYTTADTNAYCAIMRGKSICYGFSDCYNYLLRQAGIPAELLRGYRPSDHAEHGWSMIQLDGKWYHCDTTWESSGSDGLGLRYFGMSDSRRFTSVAEDVVCGFGDAAYAYSCTLCSSTRYESVSTEFRSVPWTWEKVETLLE
ncbi:MAG: transglutaminase domain-containing protein [Eubacteriales bacterium]